MRMPLATKSFSGCLRPTPAPQKRAVVAHGDYFGKDGMRQQMGGQGGADLSKLLGGSQPLDLGPASAPGGGEDDPLNFDPEGKFYCFTQLCVELTCLNVAAQLRGQPCCVDRCVRL